MRKWIMRILICGLIGGSFGWFWHHEWVKPCKSVSEYAGDEIKRIELDFKGELESLYKRTQAVEAKYRVGKEKPVKIYNGKWSKEGVLEVIK
mgnify:CR=1 FL=1